MRYTYFPKQESKFTHPEKTQEKHGKTHEKHKKKQEKHKKRQEKTQEKSWG